MECLRQLVASAGAIGACQRPSLEHNVPMGKAHKPIRLLADQLFCYEDRGYMIVRNLFSSQEVQALRNRFDEVGDAGKPIPGYWEPDLHGNGASDPLKRYPRVMMPHRYDELSLRTLLDSRIRLLLKVLLGEEPIAAQSMFYFKPPGARGQALHQDNFYLEVRPGTCVAAWLAIDPSLPENGGLSVVPGTQKMDIVCPEMAEDSESFTSHLVRPPRGMKPIPANLRPGDVLFFNGSVIHGSTPNRTSDLWRRSFICHYMPKGTTQVSRWYFPLLDFDGNVVEYPISQGGGPCGEGLKPAVTS